MKKAIGIRLIALLLILATVMTLVLTACGDDGKPSDTTVPGGNNTPGGDEQSITQMISEKYKGADVGTKEFNIVGIESGKWWYESFMEDTFNEVWYETDSAEPLESAIYTRNRRTEDLLGITINGILLPGSEEVSERIRTALDTGDTNADLAIGSLFDILTLGREGHAVNLYDIDTLDLSNVWWDQNFVHDFTLFNDRLYALSGYMNVYDDMSVSMLMFSQGLIETLKLDNPYDMVHANRWTIDNLGAMAKKATYDTGDGIMGYEDNWGLWVGTGGGTLFSGFNLPTTVQDEDGVPQLMMGDETYVQAVSDLYEAIFQSNICYDHSAGTEERDQMFSEDRLLFYWIITCQLNRYRNFTSDFGIVPMAKWKPEQTNYSSTVNQHFFSSYLVPAFNRNLDGTGIIMEVMSGYSADTVYKTTFGTMLGYDSKLLRDNDSKEMLDIIFSSKRYDFSLLGLGNIGDCLSTMETWASFLYESAYNSTKRGANAALKKIITDFEALG